MKDRKLILIISFIVISALIVFGIIFINKSEKDNEVQNSLQETEQLDEENKKKILDFFNAIAGVKAKEIEIINNPIGFKGNLFVPEESILNGVNYFLQNTNNEKMDNLDIDVEDGSINIYVNYVVTEKIKTPIKVSVRPSLNENKDLVINIEEVKFLDLKIANFIVNMALKSFVQDWFPSDSNIKVEYNKGNVVVYKENFKGVALEELSLEGDGLMVDVLIDLKKIME